MIWELYQQRKIAEVREATETAHRKTEGVLADTESIKDKTDRLALACQSLWELIRENTDLTEEDLQQKILEVDGRDGRLDGKMGLQTLECPSCARKTNSKRVTCVFCGEPIERPNQFEV